MTTNHCFLLPARILSQIGRSTATQVAFLLFLAGLTPFLAGCSSNAVGYSDQQEAEEQFAAALDGAIVDEVLSSEATSSEPSGRYAARHTASATLPFIPPGTKVSSENRKVDGFTHLVVFSKSRFTPAARKQVEAITARLASSMFTVFAADVSGGGSSHRLDRVACGVGTTVDGNELILTESTCSRLGVSLGFLHRRALSTTEDYVRKTRLLGRTETMQLIDSPIVMSVGGRNCDVLFRYAVLVHPEDGRLATLTWALTPGATRHSGPVSSINFMPANHVNDSLLTVDLTQYTFGIPGRLTYGLIAPPGRPFAAADAIGSMPASSRSFTKEQLDQAESQLRTLAFP